MLAGGPDAEPTDARGPLSPRTGGAHHAPPSCAATFRNASFELSTDFSGRPYPAGGDCGGEGQLLLPADARPSRGWKLRAPPRHGATTGSVSEFLTVGSAVLGGERLFATPRSRTRISDQMPRLSR